MHCKNEYQFALLRISWQLYFFLTLRVASWQFSVAHGGWESRFWIFIFNPILQLLTNCSVCAAKMSINLHCWEFLDNCIFFLRCQSLADNFQWQYLIQFHVAKYYNNFTWTKVSKHSGWESQFRIFTFIQILWLLTSRSLCAAKMSINLHCWEFLDNWIFSHVASC